MYYCSVKISDFFKKNRIPSPNPFLIFFNKIPYFWVKSEAHNPKLAYLPYIMLFVFSTKMYFLGSFGEIMLKRTIVRKRTWGENGLPKYNRKMKNDGYPSCLSYSASLLLKFS